MVVNGKLMNSTDIMTKGTLVYTHLLRDRVTASFVKAGDESLECFLLASSHGSIIFEEYLSYIDTADLRIGSKACSL